MTLVRLDTGLARKASVTLDGIRRDGQGALSPEIVTRLKGMPALLRTSGLPATVAFFYAKAGTADPMARAYEAVRVALVDQVAAELGWDDRPDALGFFELIGDQERTTAADLARVTGRLEEFAGWLRRFVVLRHRLWTIVTGADIPLNCKLGGGLLLPHPNGVVIHPDAEIGPNCLLFQQVTIGDAAGGVPTLEGHVDVGAGAKIIGRLKVGKHAKIGANAVVLDDVPGGVTAVGVPARSVRR